MILCYSKSFITRDAIKYLALEAGLGNVFCFHDRVRFLTSATLLNDSWVIIDTVESPPEDIKWLHKNLAGRIRDGNIYYLAPKQVLENIYCIYINTISTPADLSDLIALALKVFSTAEQRSLKDLLKEKINMSIPPAYKNLILYEQYGAEIRDKFININGRKSYLNQRYKINQKLNLKTLQEYSSMISMIN